jgi:DNA polymerase-3 subunit delta
MKLTGKSAEDFTRAPKPNVWAVLIHSEDEGVAADAARDLVASWQASGPSERIVLTEDEVARDPALLFDRLEARSLLGDQQILWLQISNEKLSALLVEAAELGEATAGRFDNRLVISSGALKSASKLRKTLESAQNAACLQLFADTAKDLESLVRGLLAADKVEIEPDALSRFTAGLPGHRRLAREEINKLALYGLDLGRTISTTDIASLSASDLDHALPALVEAALGGDAGACFRELDRLEQAGTSPISIFRALQREAERMIAAHTRGVRDAASAQKLRPPVWRDQWHAFRVRLAAWPESRLVRLIARLHACEADAKLAGAISAPTVRQLLSDVLRVAQAGAGR